MDPTFAAKMQDLERRLLKRPGTLDPSIRQAAADGAPLPEPLGPYVEKVQRHAFKVTDADIAGLRAAGYSEDQIFELTVAAAHGAARRRLRAGMDALAAPPDAGRGSTPPSASVEGDRR